MKVLLRAVSVAITLIVVTTTRIDAAPPLSGAPYELTAILSLTGPVAFTGNEFQEALHIIQDQVNATGGIQGRPLKFLIFDDQSNPQTAVQLTNQAIAKNVPVILGPAFSATCLAVGPLVTAAGPVEYCYSPVIHPIRGGFIFSSSVSALDQSLGTLRYFRSRGWSRIAFISSIDTTGQTLDRAFDYLLTLPENKSLQTVAHEHFNGSDISVAAQIARIKSAQPDVIVISSSGTPFGTVLRGLMDAGIDIPVATGSANMTYSQMSQYKDFLPKTLLFSGMRSMTPEATAPGPVRDAQRVYFAAYKAAGVRTDAGSALSWDATWVVIDALRHVGPNATAKQIRDYIGGLHGWVGINGVYDFGDSEQRGIGVNGMVMDRWDPAKNDFVAASRPGGAAS